MAYRGGVLIFLVCIVKRECLCIHMYVVVYTYTVQVQLIIIEGVNKWAQIANNDGREYCALNMHAKYMGYIHPCEMNGKCMGYDMHTVCTHAKYRYGYTHQDGPEDVGSDSSGHFILSSLVWFES